MLRCYEEYADEQVIVSQVVTLNEYAASLSSVSGCYLAPQLPSPHEASAAASSDSFSAFSAARFASTG